MKKKLLIGTLVVTMIFSLTGTVLAKNYVLKLGILSAAGGLEDQAAQKIAAVAAEKSGGQLEVQVFPAAQLGNFISQMESLAMGTQAMLWGDLGWLGNFVKDYQIRPTTAAAPCALPDRRCFRKKSDLPFDATGGQGIPAAQQTCLPASEGHRLQKADLRPRRPQRHQDAASRVADRHESVGGP